MHTTTASGGVVEAGGSGGATVPQESLGRLFVRFLRFGCLAWGGPAAQIAMIKQELVEREGWVEAARFNRVLAVYQALPGPEAHELCVYFGWVARRRVGGLVAGLGFMLPGFVLMFGAAWAYFALGAGVLRVGAVGAAFVAVQAAAAALIVRATHRIGGHAVRGPWLWAAAVVSAVAQLAGVAFWLTLGVSGLAAWAGGLEGGKRGIGRGVGVTALAALLMVAAWSARGGERAGDVGSGAAVVVMSEEAGGSANAGEVLLSGLRAGSLTFGGAYTVLPYLLDDAVREGGWISERAFLDGVAIGGVLPAPLVIVSTFVGMGAAGAVGALLMTVGVFVPAFAFTLIGHGVVERLVEFRPVHRFLDGVTAGAVGLIAATAVMLLPQVVTRVETSAVFAAGVVALYLGKSKWVTPAVVLGAAGVGAGLHAGGLAFGG